MTEDASRQAGRPLQVCSLTYHEITRDPRVFKAARALRRRGHRVTVFCPSSQDFPDREEIEGVEIVRFDAFGVAGVSRARFAEVDRLGPGRDAVMARLDPHLDEIAFFKNAFGDRFEAFLAVRSAYLEARGFGRLARLPGYIAARYRFRRERRSAGGMRWSEGRERLRASRKRLYQTIGYVYAMNLLDATRDARPDIVHAHDIYCLPGGVSFAAATGARLLYDAHEYEPARATRMDETDPRLAETLEDDCLRHVDRMITVSASIRDLYAARFHGPAPTLVFNAPPPPEPGEAAAIRDIRARAGLGPQVPLLVFTGGVQREHRGLDKVLEAMRLLGTEPHLAVMGPRHEGNDLWLRQIATSLGLERRLHLVPGVPARQVVPTIRTADIALIATQDVSLNQRFSMPNKIFEAAFAGLPIVGPDLPDMRAFMEEIGNGIPVDTADPNAIAAGIRTILAAPDAFRLSAAGRTILEETYAWEAQERRLVALVEEMAGARPRAAAPSSGP